jgi:hypothetical protein
MIFAAALVLAVLASIAAAILAFRLKRVSPAIHNSVDAPLGTEWWPFWVFHFISPTKWRRLPVGLRPVALIAVSTLLAALALFSFLLLRYVARGGSL